MYILQITASHYLLYCGSGKLESAASFGHYALFNN